MCTRKIRRLTNLKCLVIEVKITLLSPFYKTYPECSLGYGDVCESIKKRDIYLLVKVPWECGLPKNLYMSTSCLSNRQAK